MISDENNERRIHMHIAVSSDHAGFSLRQRIVEHLIQQGHKITELGAENSEIPFSYVGAGANAAEVVSRGEADRGIVVCGTGIGISIVANKTRGIRCALCTDEYMARMSRQHNDANVLALGARVVGQGLALSIVDAFLSEGFETGGRHQARVNEICGREDEYFQ